MLQNPMAMGMMPGAPGTPPALPGMPQPDPNKPILQERDELNMHSYKFAISEVEKRLLEADR